jgi:flagellar L-ring protein precursor FlgH
MNWLADIWRDSMLRTLLRLPALLLPALMGGCMALQAPKVDVAEPTQARPSAATYAPVNNGAIFQAAAYRPLYETHRARMVGDIITITISETVAAKQETTSKISKAGTVSSSITAVPLVRADQLAKLGAAGSSANTFDGKGSTESTGTFTGNITATVIEVLPNGHLIVAGEKQIGVAHNVDVLRFSGQVDPATIQPGNSVSSAQIANVRIAQTGRGSQQDAQGLGWLSRFFLSISPF